MPMLRWLGLRSTTSWPSMRITPELGVLEAGDHAQRRGLAAAGGAEEGDELALGDVEVEVAHHVVGAVVLLQVRDLEEGHGLPAGLGVLLEAGHQLDQPHAGPGDREGDHREGGGLVGAVGAEHLQVGAEGRAVEERGHGELADDDGEGEEGAGENGDQHVGQDHPGHDGEPAGAERLRGLGKGGHESMARRPVSTARYM